MPSNERRALRRNWQNLTHTYTHTQAVTTLSEKHVNCWCGLCLSDHFIPCFDPVVRHRVRITCGYVFVTVHVWVLAEIRFLGLNRQLSRELTLHLVVKGSVNLRYCQPQ